MLPNLEKYITFLHNIGNLSEFYYTVKDTNLNDYCIRINGGLKLLRFRSPEYSILLFANKIKTKNSYIFRHDSFNKIYNSTYCNLLCGDNEKIITDNQICTEEDLFQYQTVLSGTEFVMLKEYVKYRHLDIDYGIIYNTEEIDLVYFDELIKEYNENNRLYY